MVIAKQFTGLGTTLSAKEIDERLDRSLKTYKEIQVTPDNIDRMQVIALCGCENSPFATGVVLGFLALKKHDGGVLSKDMIRMELDSGHEENDKLLRSAGSDFSFKNHPDLPLAKLALLDALDTVARLYGPKPQLPDIAQPTTPAGAGS